MRQRPMGIQKHPPYTVPEGAPRDLLMGLSKSTLAELVWDYARQSVGGDEASDAKVLGSVTDRVQTIKHARALLARIEGT